MQGGGVDTSFEHGIRLLAWVFLLAALLNGLRVLTSAWDAPLLGPHDFRQTQTAITAYYLMHGGPWLAYETPVLGAPWSIPFELPLFQGLAAIVAGSGLMPLDQAGRLVSMLMFLACLPLAWCLLSRWGFAGWQCRILLALWLCSPTYLFWSRAFMIESTALFLALGFLVLAQWHLDKPSWKVALGGAVLGALAGMVKITTWYGFVGIVVLLWLHRRPWRGTPPGRQPAWREGVGLPLWFLVMPLLVALAWTGYADGVKAQNVSGAWLTSGALQGWNFGGVEQRAFRPMAALLDRSLVEALGTSAGVLLLLPVSLLIGRRALPALLALGVFCGSVFTFTNLHQVHNYYQYAVSLFLLFAAGVVIVRGLEHGGLTRWLALLSLLMVALMQLKVDWRMLERLGDARVLQVARAAREATRPEEVLMIFGADWSSVIPYYSQRRALMDRFEPGLPANPRAAEAVRQLAPRRIGAGVFCTGARADPGQMLQSILYLRLDPEPAFSNDLCQIHLPLRSP